MGGAGKATFPRVNTRSSCDPNLSVAAVHHDAEGIDVSLRERVDLKPRHEALVVAFTDCPPAHDSSVVVEPRIMSELEFFGVQQLVSVRENYCRSHSRYVVCWLIVQ